MNLLNSVFSDDPDPPSQSDVAGGGGGGGGGGGVVTTWGLGGLVRTIASRSETVIESYRRDLREFGTGLRRETASLGEAAASAAQDSLESVGRVVDDIADIIISHGKDNLFSLSDDPPSSSSSSALPSSKRYSRFDALVLGLRSDQATFLEDPEDAKEFESWRKGFDLDGAKEEEIEKMCREDAGMERMFRRLVPESVDYESFWIRYFFKINRLKQAEDVRAELVKRFISVGEEEELSWEVEDDDDDEVEEGKKKTEKAGGGGSNGEDVAQEERLSEGNKIGILDEKRVSGYGKALVEVEAKTESSEPVESCKDSDFSVVSSQPEFDDLGWDEIEDLRGSEEKKSSSSGGSGDKVDLRKRLAVAEDEDLSWDIEDN